MRDQQSSGLATPRKCLHHDVNILLGVAIFAYFSSIAHLAVYSVDIGTSLDSTPPITRVVTDDRSISSPTPRHTCLNLVTHLTSHIDGDCKL